MSFTFSEVFTGFSTRRATPTKEEDDDREERHPARPNIEMFTTEHVNPTKPKTWWQWDSQGVMKIVEIDKYSLATRLAIPLRDMRVLDPNFPTPYPSAIFIREHCIILNLEHIKVIACADQVWLLDSSTSHHFSEAFLVESLEKLKLALKVTLRVKEDPNYASCHTSFHDMQEDFYRRWSEAVEKEDGGGKNKTGSNGNTMNSEEEIKSQLMAVDLKLPYELRAVEAALNEFTRYLDAELCHLEEEASSALQTLSHQVSRSSLENVRGMKNSLNGLFARVSRAREELERLLDDDEDMINMYLCDHWELPNMGNSPHLRPMTPTIPEFSVDSININSPRWDHSGLPKRRTRRRMNQSKAYSQLQKGSVPFYEVWQEKEIDAMEAVEAFLEVYFMKSDFLMKRLAVLREKIDDTEDLINIDLDFRRNELFKVDILLTSGTMATGLVAAIAGIFGMNLESGGEPETDANSHYYFVLVAVIASVGCIVIFACLVMYLKYKKLMFVPEPKIVSSTIDRNRKLYLMQSQLPPSPSRVNTLNPRISRKTGNW